MIGGIMVVYQYALLLCDFFMLWVRVCVLSLAAIFKTVYSPRLASLAGEIVLVTGSGHGIGRELSLQFARLGCRVICLDVNEGSNKRTAEDIKKEGGSAWAYKCDVAEREQVKAISKKIREDIGEVTMVVNNAGVMPCKPFIKHTPDDIINIFRVNVFAHFWILEEWLPCFLAAGRGRVIALSSIAGLLPTANLAPYSASKFAVRGLMEGLTEELRYANRHPNIQITCVYPFVIDTGLARHPRIRFPSLNPVTSPSECASLIIEGVRRGEEVICIPPKDYYAHWMFRMMPREVQKAFIDFMDTGVDEN